jgi:hypothetical protein
MRLGVQEQLLPGSTMQAKWETALAWGFDAIELRGQGDHALRRRLPDLLAAQREASVTSIPSVAPMPWPTWPARWRPSERWAASGP